MSNILTAVAKRVQAKTTVVAAPAVLIPKAPRGKMNKAAITDLQNKLAPLDRDVKANYWKIVSLIGWGIKTTDFEGVARAMDPLNSGLHRIMGSETRKLAAQGLKALNKVDKNNTVFNRGDDGTLDGISHVIGLGQKTFTAFLANPLAFTGQGKNCVESFLYCFDDVEDYHDDLPTIDPKIQKILSKLTPAEVKTLKSYFASQK